MISNQFLEGDGENAPVPLKEKHMRVEITQFILSLYKDI